MLGSQVVGVKVRLESFLRWAVVCRSHSSFGTSLVIPRLKPVKWERLQGDRELCLHLFALAWLLFCFGGLERTEQHPGEDTWRVNELLGEGAVTGLPGSRLQAGRAVGLGRRFLCVGKPAPMWPVAPCLETFLATRHGPHWPGLFQETGAGRGS